MSIIRKINYTIMLIYNCFIIAHAFIITMLVVSNSKQWWKAWLLNTNVKMTFFVKNAAGTISCFHIKNVNRLKKTVSNQFFYKSLLIELTFKLYLKKMLGISIYNKTSCFKALYVLCVKMPTSKVVRLIHCRVENTIFPHSSNMWKSRNLKWHGRKILIYKT